MVQYTITTRVDGDVLKVFWRDCSEVGFVKVPRTLKKVILESGKYNLWKPYKIYVIIAASQRILK